MFVDAKDTQVSVSIVIRVDQNDIGFLRHNGEYNATYRRKEYHFKFHKFIDYLIFLIVGGQTSIVHWNFFNN
jgi:hypothetical protein